MHLFDLDNMKIKSGRVLPYARKKETGEIFLLLGRERFVPGWRSGSNRWSALGGKAEKNESPSKCAAREFVEESLAIPIVSNTKGWENKEVVENLLENVPYSSILFLRGQVAKRIFYHVCFLVEVPYQPCLAQEFHSLHGMLSKFELCNTAIQRVKNFESLEEEVQNHPCFMKKYESWNDDSKDVLADVRVRPCFLEMKEVQFWSLSRLRSAMRHWGRHRGKNLFRKCFLKSLNAIVDRLYEITPPASRCYYSRPEHVSLSVTDCRP